MLFKNLMEDKKKLTQQYSELSKKYKKEPKLIPIPGRGIKQPTSPSTDGNHENPYQSPTDKSCEDTNPFAPDEDYEDPNQDPAKKTKKYPVVLVGTCEIPLWPNARDNSEELMAKIKINDNPEDMYKLPDAIAPHFSDIMKVHKTSVHYNNLNIRVTDMSIDNDGILSMTTSRTLYFYSMATNRAADYKWDDNNFTVRELFEPGPMFHSLEKSSLSNHLGFNGIVISSDNHIVFVKRKKELSIGKRTYGVSIQASLKASFAINDINEDRFTPLGLVKAILHEIWDELKLSRNDLKDITLIAAYRDGLECGKPQLLFCANSSLTAEEITKQFRRKWVKNVNINSQKPERNSVSSKIKKVKLDGKKLVWFPADNLKDLIFKEDRVEFNKDDGFYVINRFFLTQEKWTQSLRMLPSTSASLALFRDYYLSKHPIEEENKS